MTACCVTLTQHRIHNFAARRAGARHDSCRAVADRIFEQWVTLDAEREPVVPKQPSEPSLRLDTDLMEDLAAIAVGVVVSVPGHSGERSSCTLHRVTQSTCHNVVDPQPRDPRKSSTMSLSTGKRTAHRSEVSATPLGLVQDAGNAQRGVPSRSQVEFRPLTTGLYKNISGPTAHHQQRSYSQR